MRIFHYNSLSYKIGNYDITYSGGKKMDIRFTFTILMLIIATTNDYKKRQVKNVIPLVMIIAGIIMNLYYKDINLLYSFLSSIIYFFCLFFIPRLLHINEFIGAGDIKLYMAISFLLGWQFSFYTFLYSLIVGIVILIILNLRRIKEIGLNVSMFFMNKGKWEIDESQEKTNMFTIYILIGCIMEYLIHYDWLLSNLFNL